MLASWTRILPYFVVMWLTKRNAERFDIIPGFHCAVPFKDEVISWRKQ